MRTTDHGEIRSWVEERGGRPAIIEDTWDGNSAILEVDFNDSEDSLMEISWDEFFRIFDENNLDFLCQEETAEGEKSRFFKFVDRDGDDEDDDKDKQEEEEKKDESDTESGS